MGRYDFYKQPDSSNTLDGSMKGLAAALIFFFILSGLGYFLHGNESSVKNTPTVLTSDFMFQLMDTCEADLSIIRKQVLTTQIQRIAGGLFPGNQEHQEAFAFLICIESRFNSKAKSKAGAVGLTQVMPRFAAEFAEYCSLGKPTEEDLYYPEINLTIGACNFKALLDYHQSIALALAAYNSGKNSSTVKKLSNLQQGGHPETVLYVSKYAVLRDKMERLVMEEKPDGK